MSRQLFNLCRVNYLIYVDSNTSTARLVGIVIQLYFIFRRGTHFEFALVYPDLRMGKYLSRDIGQTVAGNKVRLFKDWC